MYYMGYVFCNRQGCRKYTYCGHSVVAAEMCKKDLKRMANDLPIKAAPHYDCKKFKEEP